MPVKSFDEAVSRLMKAHDIPRGEAVDRLIRGAEDNDPRVLEIPDMREAILKERMLGTYVRPFATFAHMAGKPFAQAQDALLGTESEKLLKDTEDYYGHGVIRDPFTKTDLGNVAADLAGTGLAFEAGLGVAGPAIRWGAGKIAGVVPEVAQLIRTGDAAVLQSPAVNAAKPAIAKAAKISRYAEPAIVGGALGPVYDPEHPYAATVFGAGMGAAFPAMEEAVKFGYSKWKGIPIEHYLTRLESKESLQYLSKTMGVPPEDLSRRIQSMREEIAAKREMAKRSPLEKEMAGLQTLGEEDIPEGANPIFTPPKPKPEPEPVPEEIIPEGATALAWGPEMPRIDIPDNFYEPVGGQGGVDVEYPVPEYTPFGQIREFPPMDKWRPRQVRGVGDISLRPFGPPAPSVEEELFAPTQGVRGKKRPFDERAAIAAHEAELDNFFHDTIYATNDERVPTVKGSIKDTDLEVDPEDFHTPIEFFADEWASLKNPAEYDLRGEAGKREDVLESLRQYVEEYLPAADAMGFKNPKKVTDEQLLAAAKDAYESRKGLIARYKSSNKLNQDPHGLLKGGVDPDVLIPLQPIVSDELPSIAPLPETKPIADPTATFKVVLPPNATQEARQAYQQLRFTDSKVAIRHASRIPGAMVRETTESLGNLSPVELKSRLGNYSFGDANTFSLKEYDRLPTTMREVKAAYQERRTASLTKKGLGEKGGIGGSPQKIPYTIDEDAFEKGWGTLVDDLTDGVDTDPATALLNNDDLGFIWPWLRRPAAVMARVTGSRDFYDGTMQAKHNLMTVFLGKMDRIGQRVFKNPFFDGTEESFSKFQQALEGTKLLGTGQYIQADSTVDPIVAALAKRYRQYVMDPIFEKVRGYSSQAATMIQEAGMKDEEETLKRLWTVQRALKPEPGSTWRPTLPADITPEETALATQLYRDGKSMLKFNIAENGRVSHDIGGGGYVNGYFPMIPVKHERMELVHKIHQLEESLHNGLAGSPGNTQALLSMYVGRLKELDDAVVQREAQQAGQLGRNVPRWQLFGPFQLRKGGDPQLAKMLNETDPKKLHQRYVHGALAKRYFDVMLTNAREYLPTVGPNMRGYMLDWLDGQRGISSYKNDEQLRRLFSSIGTWGRKARGINEPYQASQEDVRNFFSEVMKFQVLTKLFSSPRFMALNLTQPITTTWGLVKTPVMYKALAKTVQDLQQLGKIKRGELSWPEIRDNSWYRAFATGVVEDSGAMLRREAEGFGGSKLSTLMDWWPGTRGAEFTEKFNRVFTANAADLQMQTPEFKPHKALVTFFDDPHFTPEQRRQAYQRAMVRETQFSLAREDRPLAFVSSTLGRTAGQFRTYQVGYMTLFKNMLKHDPLGAGKMVAALGLLGGVTSVPLYKAVRHHLIKNGLYIPEQSGIAQIANELGINPPQFLDVSAGLDPVNMPRTGEDILPNLLGPTFGSGYDLAKQAISEGPFSPQMARAAIRTVSPQFLAMGEAIVEKDEGVKTPSGRPLVMPSQTRFWARLGGLVPSSAGMYYDLKEKLQSAMEGQQYDIVARLLREAEANNVIIDKKTMSQIQGQITRERNRHAFTSPASPFRRQ